MRIHKSAVYIRPQRHLSNMNLFSCQFAKMGDLGSKLPPSANKTKWVAGTYVEVAWGPLYNHGGGYQVSARSVNCCCEFLLPLHLLEFAESFCFCFSCSVIFSYVVCNSSQCREAANLFLLWLLSLSFNYQ